MKRIVTAALLAAFAGFLLPERARRRRPRRRACGPRRLGRRTDTSRARRRALRRVPIYPRRDWEPDVYPRYNPGPNAVRECNATYVQEYRPSGTVITPRMNCYWRPG